MTKIKSKEMSNITIIVPMNDLNDKNLELLDKALSSVPNDFEVLISCKKGTDTSSLKGNVITTAEGDSFQELVNSAVESVGTEWFSILEFDDTYTSIWFNNVKKEIEYKPEVSVFMPLEDITDFNNNGYIGFGNEAPWASAFSNELGYIDLDALQAYYDFYATGSVFNTKDWKEIGGLKPHIKVTFWYEWMLRATNNSKKIYVIPKVGYNHTLGRDGSLTETYKKEITEDEIKWWFDLAKRDYFFKEEKEPSYYIYKKQEDDNEE